MQQLQKNRLFAGVSPELISEVGADMNLARYDRDDIIFREGDPGDCLYLVVEGSVRISKTGRGGQQETLGFIQPGNFFGEMALIDGQPRSAQASASEPCTLGRVDNAAFARILEIAPRDLLMNFLRSATERLRGINSHFISELMRNERLSVVGSMANSIIHDLNNPLFIIQNCTEFIYERMPDPAVEKYVNMIRRASDNMGAMTQELLDFARGRSSIQPSRVLVAAVFTELDDQITRLLPSNISMVREMESTAEIVVDVRRFARMLLNLVKNAIEAMPQGGTLRLKVHDEREGVIFQVSDTGCGIDPELQARIFEPFVTFGKSKGTGLGMAIVKSVVDAHGGTIKLSSAVGVGTTVEVELPVASAV